MLTPRQSESSQARAVNSPFRAHRPLSWSLYQNEKRACFHFDAGSYFHLIHGFILPEWVDKGCPCGKIIFWISFGVTRQLSE
jgi:hypothetical protein